MRAVARKAEGLRWVEQAGGEAIALDLREGRSLGKAARGCEVVYHLAGGYRGGMQELYSSHVQGTLNLVRAVDPGARIVFLSSTSVYGWGGPWPAGEGTPTRPASHYGHAKLAAERVVLGRGGVVVRSCIVYGPGDTRGMLPRAFLLLSRGLRFFPGDGKNPIHLIHVGDLIDGLLRAARAPAGVYLLAGPEPASVGRVLSLVAEAAGVSGPLFGFPPWLARRLARGAEALWVVLGLPGEAPLTVHSVEVLTRARWFRTDRARQVLGWEPRVGLEEGLRELGVWLRDRFALAQRGWGKRAGPLPFW